MKSSPLEFFHEGVVAPKLDWLWCEATKHPQPSADSLVRSQLQQLCKPSVVSYLARSVHDPKGKYDIYHQNEL